MLPNVGPYIYMTLAFLALLGAPYIYEISSLRVNLISQVSCVHKIVSVWVATNCCVVRELMLRFFFGGAGGWKNLSNNNRLWNCDADVRVMLTLLSRNYWAVRMGGGQNWLSVMFCDRLCCWWILKYLFSFLVMEAKIKILFLIISSLLPFLTF